MNLEQLGRKFELSDSPHRIHPVEGVRGMAILMVLFGHFEAVFAAYLPKDSASAWLAGQLHLAGRCGVDMFFALSGFLIYGILMEKRPGFVPFFRRRLVRLYPAFLACFLLYSALTAALPARSRHLSTQDYLLDLLMLSGIFGSPNLITHAWSLRYEFAFYFSIGFLMWAFRFSGRTAAERVAILTAVGAAYAIYRLTAPPVYIEALRLAPSTHSRMLTFLGGIYAWEFLRVPDLRQRLSARTETAATMLFGGGLAGVCALFHYSAYLTVDFWRALLLVAILFLYYLHAFGRSGTLAWALSWRPLRHVGNMSYSIFLFHGLAYHGMRAILMHAMPPNGEAARFWLLYPPVLAGALIFSAIMFLLVERPLSLRPSISSRRPSGAHS